MSVGTNPLPTHHQFAKRCVRGEREGRRVTRTGTRTVGWLLSHIRDDIREGGVAEPQPATRSDPVGLVLELLWCHFKEILEAGTERWGEEEEQGEGGGEEGRRRESRERERERRGEEEEQGEGKE